MKNSLKNSVALLRAKTGQLVTVAGAASAALVSNLAHAAGESASATEALTAVTATKNDMVLVFGGVLTMAIAIWGIYKIVKIFGGK
jgi:hypothetical protein